MFLPYYVAQDVGWVFKQKSFRGFDFIRNFKTDYYDYYFGIFNDTDKNEKLYLEAEKKVHEETIKRLVESESNNEKIQIAKLSDEEFVDETYKYIEKYSELKNETLELETKFVESNNKLGFLEQRKLILGRIKRSLNKNKPLEGNCPTCSQPLKNDLAKIYEYQQDLNDTKSQLDEINSIITKMKAAQKDVNSSENNLKENHRELSKKYSVLKSYKSQDFVYDTWLNNKVTLKYQEDIKSKIASETILLAEVVRKLEKFADLKSLDELRTSVNSEFATEFIKYLRKLGVKDFDEYRYYNLYKVPNFPRQGVELLKTMMAYVFTFNKLIRFRDHVHRLPFMLDAIFEGDFEKDNREKILSFIQAYKPVDTQLIVTIADTKKNDAPVADYNLNFFENKANLICIGANSKDRAFLGSYDKTYDTYVADTFEILES